MTPGVSSVARRSSLQNVPTQPRRLCQPREAQAEADTYNLHQRPAEGAGEGLRRDPLPRHLHPGGDRDEDRPHRG